MTNGSLMSVSVQGEGRNNLHIQANRDYYTTNTSFNGTSGVGEGPLSSRPSSCTTGVAYWATDQGEWNSLQAGPDGRLYKCTATNTWSLYYTPQTFPHPWQTGGAPAPVPPPGAPAAPTNLRIITLLLWSLPVMIGIVLAPSVIVRRR
jgi:hypothetical protein